MNFATPEQIENLKLAVENKIQPTITEYIEIQEKQKDLLYQIEVSNARIAQTSDLSLILTMEGKISDLKEKLKKL